MRYGINRIYDQYQLPIFVLELGTGMHDVLEDGRVHDQGRIDYLHAHIEQLREIIYDGVPVMGCLMWGPIDIVANSSGEMSKRYGFIYVDIDDSGNGSGKRIKKDSFWWFRKLVDSNGEQY